MFFLIEFARSKSDPKVPFSLITTTIVVNFLYIVVNQKVYGDTLSRSFLLPFTIAVTHLSSRSALYHILATIFNHRSCILYAHRLVCDSYAF